MRLCSYECESGTRAGRIEGDRVIDIGADLTPLVWSGSPSLDGLATAAGPSRPLDAVRLRAPFRPRRIIAVGLNYRTHGEETNLALTPVPSIFPKFAESVVGPGEPIVLPRLAREIDYEAELAFVVGRAGRHIPPDRAMEHVAGYACLNDVSARDYQFATSQWMAGKVFDSFCPFGPWLVTRDEIADPHRLAIRCWVGGELMQDGRTADMIFPIPRLIEYLSGIFTLLPGDVVATGTPPGVGLGREPKRWLGPGESVRVEVAGVGTLENPCRAEV